MLAALVLGISVILFSVAIPYPDARFGASPAVATEPTPIPSGLLDDLESPSPSPSPTPSASPKPKDEKDKNERPSEKMQDRKHRSFEPSKHEGGDGGRRGHGKVRGGRKGERPTDAIGAFDVFVGVHRVPGSFNTDELMAIALRLSSLGWSAEGIQRHVYAPFIIAGEATWTDTWGALRRGPKPKQVRSHEGQDVFCEEGAPVLAAEAGMIEFDEGLLGGRVARLFRDDGSYWYYAHLADWNLDQFSSGDSVEKGDVLGYCGRTGNALSTPPHVHFGWYQADGSVLDPMETLIGWLSRAEKSALSSLKEAAVDVVLERDVNQTARRFGGSLVPSVPAYLSDHELAAARSTDLLDFLLAGPREFLVF